jgi:hypothetical protein
MNTMSENTPSLSNGQTTSKTYTKELHNTHTRFIYKREGKTIARNEYLWWDAKDFEDLLKDAGYSLKETIDRQVSQRSTQ